MRKTSLNQSGELEKVLSQMEQSFQRLFVIGQGRGKICRVIEALELDEHILPLIENDNGSFSTLFSPFHGGTVLPKSKSTLIEQDQIHPKLRAFCRLSGEIESMTDTMSTYDGEPSSGEKRSLLPLLKEFAVMIPNKEEFESWIKKSK